MRVLVAGRTGQLATELLRRLPQAGHAVVAMEAPELDLTDRDSILRAMEAAAPDAVVNAAAYTAVDGAETQRDLAFAVNTIGAAMLASASAARGLPLIHLSTDYVFAGNGGAPYDEDAEPGPIGVYGASKLGGERAALAANPRTAILRTAWLCSPHGANFVKTMLRLARERDELTVVEDQVGGPTPAAALADACLRIAAGLREGAPTGTYHLAGTPDTSWATFAAEILREAGLSNFIRPIPTSEWHTPAKRPLNSRLECGLLCKVFGIDRPDWRPALQDVVRELKAGDRRYWADAGRA